MKLELVPIEDFEKRKAAQLRGLRKRDIDRQFGTLIVDSNALPFFYTIESCYGKFGDYHYFKPGAERNDRYSIGFLSFGLDYTEEAQRFLEEVKEIKNRNLFHCLLIDDALGYYSEGLPKRFRTNEFCFGVVSLDEERVRNIQIDVAVFRTVEDARKFEPIRDRIWDEWRELVERFKR